MGVILMGSDTTTWFENQLKEFEKDPQFQADYALMDVTERICKVHGRIIKCKIGFNQK